MRGIVKNVMEGKNFGFIRGEDGTEYFFHREEFNGHWGDMHVDVKNGMKVRVEFEEQSSSKGPRAAGVYRWEHPDAGR